MQKNIDITKKPTTEQMEMLSRAAKLPIPEDAEYPEFSKSELQQFKKISAVNRAERNKQTITLRISPQALRNAKSLGKGYTSVLSRILEQALENPDTVKRHL